MGNCLDELSGSEIAIVGFALRVPGATDAATFFENLKHGVESIRRLEDEELRSRGETPERLAHPRYVKVSAELPGMDLFDGDLFGFSPKECAILDPQHRQFLECAYEAIEDSGHVPSSFGGPIGVYAGCGMGTYFYSNLLSNRELVDSVGTFLLRHTGNDKDFLATRLSYLLDLRGPSVNVQTACSTSLVAVHQAAQSLLSRECDLAIAGGATIELPHGRGYIFEEGEILSPDGHCHAFDHRASGTVFGSGVGVVVLRRLEDALADGDVIHAVIKGTAVNNDGSGKAGYLAPSVEGQAAAIVEAHTLAGVEPASIGYVECHGTGTYLGDPIEIAALTQAFRQGTRQSGFCRVGSVKSNIGHLDTAAGVVGLIKASLALEKELIPPTISFEKPNPAIDFESTPFVVNDKAHPWKRSENVRRAGVNSLGVGGTNCHVVLEEAPLRPERTARSLGPQVFSYSAKSRASLDGYAGKLADFLEANPSVDLGDVAHSLRVGRRALDKRRVFAAKSAEEAISVLRSLDPRRVFTHEAIEAEPSLVFMFPGGGAQYVGMAKGLYETRSDFAAVVDEGLSYLAPKIDFDPLALLFHSDSDIEGARRELEKPSVQLPLTLIIEVALARYLIDQGLKPSALIGHSMGENAAACVAGVLSFRDAVALVHLRGTLFDSCRGGGMLSVAMAPSSLRELLGDELDLAVENGPELSVASGPRAALEALSARLDEIGVEYQRIRIDIAAHSRMLEPILSRFLEFVRTLRLSAPKIPIVSNRTGETLSDADATSPEYWVNHLRNTIRFAAGLENLTKDARRVFVEVGPGRALSSLARQHPSISSNLVVPMIRHEDEHVDDETFFVAALGRLAALNVPIPTSSLEPADCRKVRIPTYAFAHRRYFMEPVRASAEAAGPSLGRNEGLRSFGYRPTWAACDTGRLVDADAKRDRRALVFLDDAGVGEALVRAIRDAGGTAIVVEPGDAFASRGPDHFVISPENQDDTDRLVRELVGRGGVPSEIIHLWLLTSTESFRPGSSLFHRNLECGFHSLFALGKALIAETSHAPTSLLVVSNGMHGVLQHEAPLHPEKAVALGPVLVLPREAPNLSVRAVDLDLPIRKAEARLFSSQLRALASALLSRARDEATDYTNFLLAELDAKGDEAVVAYRGGKRWARIFVEAPLEDAALTFARNEPGVVLVTGGLGGVASAVSESLAKAAPGTRFVFLTRREFPARERWAELRARSSTEPSVARALERIATVEAVGGEVYVETADVTNVEDVRRVEAELRRRLGGVTAIIHAAGAIRDSLVATKTLRDVEQVFAPKIHGTVVLDRVFSSTKLDFFVVFSSTSAITGPLGQVDYVGANSFLDAFAQERSARTGQPTISLAWGIWGGVGMAHDALQRREPKRVPVDGSALHGAWIEDASGRRALEGAWSPKSNAILDDHRTSDGRAIVPGTGYVEMVAEALAEYGDGGPFELRDLLFLRPISVEDDGAALVRTRLVSSRDGYEVEMRSRETVGADSGWVLNAQAQVALGASVPLRPSAVGIDEIEARCPLRRSAAVAHLVSAQEKHLRFGRRFKVLRETCFGDSEALARLSLDPDLEDEVSRYVLHPGLLDLATGFAMRLIEGYDSDDSLWVPVSYERLALYERLPARIVSWVRRAGRSGVSDGTAAFDVTLCDERGNVLADIRGFSIRRLGATSFESIGEPRRAELELDANSESSREASPAELRLRAQLALGLSSSEGGEAFLRVLASGGTRRVVSSIPLDTLVRDAKAAAPPRSDGPRFERPDLESEYVAPSDDLEKALVGYWEELLGVSGIGVADGFFDLGGHSLIAVRLFARMKKAFGVDFPISVLFEAPTIAKCAALVRSARGDVGADPMSLAPSTAVMSAGAEESVSGGHGGADGTANRSAVGTRATGSQRKVAARFTHLVALHPGEGRMSRPFFLVAGMFGNVLNLRHLGHLIGEERPFYALQARGLFGDAEPHETFEDMASDYIREMRAVQPHGPYSLGGFSGGGITAYEIARTLRSEGEVVDVVVLLDTPLPVPEELAVRDRLAIQALRLREQGPAYVAQWAEKRIGWEIEKLLRRGRNVSVAPSDAFHDHAIESAFRRALVRYEVRPYDGKVVLFRPKLDERYKVSGRRFVNAGRQYVYADNRWSSFVPSLEVYEVPGDHDSMVLEPNVRVLASRMRATIDAAERDSLREAAE